MKNVLVLIFIIFIFLKSNSQEKNHTNLLIKYVNGIINDTNNLSSPKIMNYPTLAFSPETSWEIGLSSLYIYSANRDLQNRLSEVKAFTFYTLENQYGFWFDHGLYTHQNKWFFLGKARFQSFPLLYHGIGSYAPEKHVARIDGNFTYFKERILREIIPNLYTGLELDIQILKKVSYQNTANQFIKPNGGNGSTNIGLGWGFVYNNIHVIFDL